MELAKLKFRITETDARRQTMLDIDHLIGDLLDQMAANVDQTQEKATCTVKIDLATDKTGNHDIEISGKVTLNTEKIRHGVKIINEQLTLFETS